MESVLELGFVMMSETGASGPPIDQLHVNNESRVQFGFVQNCCIIIHACTP